MGKKIIIIPEAQVDLEEIAEFYEEQELGLGAEVYEFLETHIDALLITGGLHPIHHRMHRLVVLGRFPYFTVHYRLINDGIVVLMVLDQRRDPLYNLQKLRRII
ncbi:hypothetical protein SAMN02745166_04666 [Prosthecobacter debontii]|uniref:Plasmid stabilization system protein ParE n=1 Tax=Prosthecobacter debontii TaxID=48467 RepID=A0A1T4Z134_9BACT|nr:type II toxin-antitoxin system RelE/ParE family toxin [Prosthecobacter debontii]SKB07255.1 hypothetical protein SAMN02745166_04666 [Prosthecobacter debontii]